MNWVERRDAQDAGMPELWSLLCIQFEQVAESFGKTLYARNNRLIVAAKRIKNCVHVMRAISDGSQPEESIEVCLDEKGRRVFSRINGEERALLSFGSDNQGKTCLLDSQGNAIQLDDVSKFFLEAFLFQ